MFQNSTFCRFCAILKVVNFFNHFVLYITISVIYQQFFIQIGERLKKVRILLGFSKALPFSEKLGLENPTYGRYENGERSLPDNVKLQLYEMGVNILWLVTGQGEPLLDNQIERIPLIEELREIIEKTMEPKLGKVESRLSALEKVLRTEKPVPEETTAEEGPLYTAELVPAYGEDEEEYEYLPYVHDIAAGPPIAINEDQGETVAVPCRLLKKGERYYTASIRGGSMTKAGILDGDMVLIRYTDVPRDGAIQVVRYQEKVTIKRLREIEGKGWELRYTDGSGKVIECDSEEYETLGEFVTILSKKQRPTVVLKPL
jgi:SOS-response transcriptional repressor LexA